MPLYEIVHASQSTKSHAPLVDRAAGIFINRLCHAKVVSQHFLTCPETTFLCVCVCVQYPKVGVDYTDVHEKLHQLVQCLYKGNAVLRDVIS